MPLFERHERRVQLILVELDNGFWMVEHPVKVGPVPHRVRVQLRGRLSGVETLLVRAGFDGLLSVDDGLSGPIGVDENMFWPVRWDGGLLATSCLSLHPR